LLLWLHVMVLVLLYRYRREYQLPIPVFQKSRTTTVLYEQHCERKRKRNLLASKKILAVNVREQAFLPVQVTAL
jgi:hypothetical protein